MIIDEEFIEKVVKKDAEEMISADPCYFPAEWIRSITNTLNQIEQGYEITEAERLELLLKIEEIRYSVEYCAVCIKKHPKSEDVDNWEYGIEEAKKFLEEYGDKIIKNLGELQLPIFFYE